jgi:hypothetical protein
MQGDPKKIALLVRLGEQLCRRVGSRRQSIVFDHSGTW